MRTDVLPAEPQLTEFDNITTTEDHDPHKLWVEIRTTPHPTQAQPFDIRRQEKKATDQQIKAANAVQSMFGKTNSSV